jgi:hypothetical protein
MAGRRRGQVHWFYDEVYRENYYVLYAYKPYALIDFAKGEKGEELNEPPDHIGGAFWGGREASYIWIGEEGAKSDLHFASVIAHECSHAAIRLLSDKGVETHPENDEPFCYYLGYLVRKVTELAPKNFVKKGGV